MSDIFNRSKRQSFARQAGTILLLMCGLLVIAYLFIRRHYLMDRELIAALVRHDGTKARQLLLQGADPNTRYRQMPLPSLRQMWNRIAHNASAPNNSPTALAIACGAQWTGITPPQRRAQRAAPDSVELVERMLKRGAAVDPRDEFDWTPLMWAIKDSRNQTVGVLVRRGANVNFRTPTGETPLMVAVTYNNVSAASLLLDHGVDPRVKNANAVSPLEMAVGSPAIIRMLLDHGAEADARDNDGQTALMLAMGAPETVRLLLDHGANPNAREHTGQTALMFAFAKESVRIVLERGADPNIRNNKGETALMLSIDDPEIVRLLLAYGADPTIKDRQGLSAMTAAQGNPDLMNLLQQAAATKRSVRHPASYVRFSDQRTGANRIRGN